MAHLKQAGAGKAFFGNLRTRRGILQGMSLAPSNAAKSPPRRDASHDTLLTHWATEAIHDANPQWRAAVGLAQAVLLPDGACTDAQRQEAAALALALHPGVGGAMLAMAWAIPDREPRRVLHSLGLDPLKCWRSQLHRKCLTQRPWDSGAPAVVVALARGNLPAIAQALEDLGLDGAVPLEQAGSAPAWRDWEENWVPVDPMGDWLAWALFFQQWEVADYLWKQPGLAERADLDRALFECVRGATGHHATHGSSRPVAVGALAQAGRWMGRLLEAGARPDRPFVMKGWHYDYFVGSAAGLDETKLREEGWERGPSRGYALSQFWRRGRDRSQPLPSQAWNAAQMLARDRSAVLWPRPRGLVPQDERQWPSGQREQALADFREAAGALTRELGPEQWLGVLSRVMEETTRACFSSGTETVVAWPGWVEEGFAACPAQMLAERQPGTPWCPWLDLMAVHVVARRSQGLTGDALRAQDWAALAAGTGRVLESLGQRLPADPALWQAAMARAVVVAGDEEAVSCALHLPGLSHLLARLPEAFQAKARGWVADHARLVEQAHAIRKTAATDEDPAHLAARQALALHRVGLGSLGLDNGAPRPRL